MKWRVYEKSLREAYTGEERLMTPGPYPAISRDIVDNVRTPAKKLMPLSSAKSAVSPRRALGPAAAVQCTRVDPGRSLSRPCLPGGFDLSVECTAHVRMHDNCHAPGSVPDQS